jgi:hypothetical protein
MSTLCYPAAPFRLAQVRGRCFMFWNLHRFSGAPVVGTLLSGASARAAEGESDAALQAAAMALLERIHPDADVPKPRACHVSRWGSEPFTRCANSSETPRGIRTPSTLPRLLRTRRRRLRKHCASMWARQPLWGLVCACWRLLGFSLFGQLTK